MRGKALLLLALAAAVMLVPHPVWAPVVGADTFPPYVNVSSDNPTALTNWQRGTTTGRVACSDPGGSGCDTSKYGIFYTTTNPGSSWLI